MAAVTLNLVAAQQQRQEEEIRERMIHETEEEEDDEASEGDLGGAQLDAGQQRRPYTKKRFWVRPWVSHDRRLLYGHFTNLMTQLRIA